MVDETENTTEEPTLNHDYYDEVEEGAYERSAQNTSVPNPADRDLWQSTNITTDGSGPTVADVAPVFAQARADALAHPVTADDDDDALKTDQAASAEAAQEQANAIRKSDGYVAPTGADAGQYDDPSLEGTVPAENFSPAPEPAEGERTVAEAKAEEGVAPAETDTTEVDQQFTPATDAPVDETPEDVNHDGFVDEDEARAATE